MAVDYTGTHAGVPTYAPADTTMLYQHTRSRISALVHYFNLHDVKARGKYVLLYDLHTKIIFSKR